MIRDPFYRDIEARLGEKLDSELFERCAADLLRAIHPTLVPIRGGDDAGMDGAIADEGGLPFPLVTTTGTRVIGNLRSSLKSYLRRGGTRRAAVLATSQSLTSRRRGSLEKAAGELGFTLIQIHDRAAFADLLYRDPRWCRELLGLIGVPPALSVMPLPTRPLVGDTLVGRAEDLKWLEDTDGDLLVVGQPGSGKTFLLHSFARRAGALFVHTTDLAAIAAGVRAEQPTALIMDDAHLQVDLLQQLRRLRIETGADFRLIADCWPGSRNEVARVMDLPSGSIRELSLLSMDEIAEIVKGTGIGGPRGLIQEIVDQAEGKPGLAVTLCTLCLRGDIEALAHGDALAGEVTTVFEKLVGEGVSAFLAAFAVGGNTGMTMQAVAGYQGEPLHSIREFATKLAAGGLLSEVGRERLEVRPPALRHALVRDVFFRGPTCLSVEPLVAVATNQDDVTRTVIGAIARGAHVPSDQIRGWVQRSSAAEVWAMYAGLGRQEAQWVAAEHREWLTEIGGTMLHVAPDLVLPALLDAAVGDTRALNSHPGHPLRQIGDWVVAATPGTPAVWQRRRQLKDAADRWWREGGDPVVGLQALTLALSPSFSRTESVPGSGRTITFSHGFVSLEDARAIRALWPSVRDRLRDVAPRHWTTVRELVDAWAHPGRAPQPLPEELAVEAKAFACEMLRDIVEVAKDRPGVIHWVRRITKHLEVDLELPVDRTFDTLFPDEELHDWLAVEAVQREQASQLADEWARSDPREVVPRLLWCEEEGQLIGHPWPRWTPFVCDRIAEEADECTCWLEILLEREGGADLVQPFLKRLLRDDAEAARQIARQCLDNERQRLATAVTLLASESTPSDLMELALDRLDGGANWINVLCLRSELPETSIRRLLSHPDDTIVSKAAIGVWHADPKGKIAESLREQWKQAILRCSGDEWFLREIFQADPALAVEWLTQLLQKNERLWRYEETINAALRGLQKSDRRQLMYHLPEDLSPPEIVRQLIGLDRELYQELLGIERIKHLHLAPLIGYPNPSDWADKARLALDVGYSAEQIVDAAFGHKWSWRGNLSDMWNEWVMRFDELRRDPDARIRQIGELGRALAAERAERALKEERARRIRGF